MSSPTEKSGPEAALARLGITLPSPYAPVASYIPARRSGNLLYISGQVPFRDGKLVATGAVPSQVSLETARECALQCAINGLAAAKATLGSLDRIRQVVRVGCFVACDSGFGDQPKVANAASELLQQVFGEAGRHARAAVGTNALPLNVPVEVEFLFEVE
jgi:enamine deaminase RidA (YjgF/YER057c/UK114 family)